MTGRPIAIYGATGHTGRLVAAELASHGHDMVLAGRNAQALHALADQLGTAAPIRVAGLDDPDALRAVAENAAVVINCVGPFSHSGEAVASAAIAASSHYLDHATEPLYIQRLFDTMQERARDANVVVIPGMSFYGAIADLLADVVTEGMPRVDNVTVAYAVRGWRMTPASKKTAQLLSDADRVRFSDGAFEMTRGGLRPEPFTFPAPIGSRAVLTGYPAGEAITIPRHVPTRSVEVLMTKETFTEDAVFTSENLDAAARAGSTFTIVVRATSPNGTRVGRLRGHDIYRVGAMVSVQAATQLAAGHTPTRTGVLSAAEAFRSDHFLDALQQRGLVTMISE